MTSEQCCFINPITHAQCKKFAEWEFWPMTADAGYRTCFACDEHLASLLDFEELNGIRYVGARCTCEHGPKNTPIGTFHEAGCEINAR